MLTRSDLLHTFQGLGDIASPSKKPKREGLTGIESVDRFLWDVQDSVSDLKTAMTITTACSVAAALGTVLLLIRTGRSRA